MVTVQVHSPVCVTEANISVLTDASPVYKVSYKIVKRRGYASLDIGRQMSPTNEKLESYVIRLCAKSCFFGYFGEVFDKTKKLLGNIYLNLEELAWDRPLRSHMKNCLFCILLHLM